MEISFLKSVFSKIILTHKITKTSYMRMNTHARLNPHSSYEEVIELLNGLQPNIDSNQKMQTNRDRLNELQTIRENLLRNGITMDDVDGLKIIHVSGTKGKGSTCAFCESIMRHKGYKTGFFSSPHMVEVRERIRINGKPLSRSNFIEYFIPTYKSIVDQPKENSPTYFRFMILMAMSCFIKEKVDVAIIEVGVGGAFDGTNFIRKPTVCGVTSLGLDHTDILGDNLASIAWNKAGIFKSGTPAVTVTQKEEGMRVIIERAKEIDVPLYLCNRLPINVNTLGIPGQIQVLNASLAVQLCSIWFKLHSKDPSERSALPPSYSFPTECPSLTITPDLQKGLSECFLPGRCQKIKTPTVTYYLDGAHTEDSMREASVWLDNSTRKEAKAFKGRTVKVLMFAVTGNRDPKTLIKELMKYHFDYAIFTTTISSFIGTSRKDCKFNKLTDETSMERAFRNRYVWEECMKHKNLLKNTQNGITKGSLYGNYGGNCNDFQNDNSNASSKGISNDDFDHLHIKQENFLPLPAFNLPTFPISQPKPSPHTKSFVMPSIHDSLVWISNNNDTRFSYTATQAIQAGFKFPFGKVEGSTPSEEDLLVQVVCMGSFYLVGGMLNFIQPHLNQDEH